MKWAINSINRFKVWFPFIVFFIVFIGIHNFGLGQMVSADEPLYVRQSGGFYYGLANGEFEQTNRVVHPGVTTLWAGTAGYLVQFPAYAEMGGSDLSDFDAKQLLDKHGTSDLAILITARRFILGFNAALLVLSFFFLNKLLPKNTLYLGMAGILLDPFLFDHVRILGTDGILSTTMLLCISSYLVYLDSDKRLPLLVSGIAAGLAFLSKSSAIGLLPIIGLIEIFHTRQHSDRNLSTFRKSIPNWLLWATFLLLTVFTLWPAMWVDLIDPFRSVYEFTFEAGVGEARFSSVTFYNGKIYPAGQMNAPFFYLINMLWRTTPLVWVGLALGIYGWREIEPKTRWTLSYLLLYAVLFIGLMTLSGKKFDRYILPSFVVLIILASAGWGWLFAKIRVRWQRVGLYIGLIGLQIALLLPVQPYYLSYYNPVMRIFQEPEEVMLIGWGEGLDQAANFLNEQEDIYYKTVYAWYPSVLDFHFYGHPSNPKPVYYYLGPGDAGFDDVLTGDYVVLYVHQWQRDIPAALLRIYERQEPVYTVEINGIEYARVYKNE